MYGRTKDGKVDEFGVSGYVYEDTFIIFDRRTESLWYPFDDVKWTAISGPRRGETIPFITEAPVVTLGQWREKHPQTVVLLGPKGKTKEAKKTPAKTRG